MQHYFILFSLFIKCSLPNCHFQDTPLLFLHHYNRPCGKRNIKSLPFCKKTPPLYLFASLHNLNPINTPSPSLSLHFTSFSSSSSSSLLPAASNREATERELLLLLPSSPNFTTFNLQHFVRTGSSFWIGAVFLLRRQNLEPATPFGLGPSFPSLDAAKILLGE